jgi:GT2 family glycosyltransferase
MKINVLTVTYNQLESLKRLYQSILDQKDYLNEWILFDDISTDGTREWMKTIENKEIKTKFILPKTKDKDSPLVVGNMNKCFKALDNDDPFILVFADTYLGKDALKNLSETYILNTFGSSYRTNVDKDDNVTAKDCYLPDDLGVINLSSWPNPWLKFPGNGMVATKEIMESIGGIDESYTGYGVDDFDTACRAFMNGALLIRYHNVRVYHLDHPAKTTTQDNIDRLAKRLSGNGFQYNGKVVTLDFDDFSIENNNFYYLDQLKRIYPKLKVSMFYIPFDVSYFDRIMDFQRKEGIRSLKDRLDWIELIPHGLTHIQEEFLHIKDDDYETVFKGIEEAYKTYDLPMVKGFKAPQWAYKSSLVEYLNDKGWWLAVDRNQPESPRTKKNFVYTHSTDEPFWLCNKDSINLHGHISLPSRNNLVDNLVNLLKINPKVEWKFVSEVMND